MAATIRLPGEQGNKFDHIEVDGASRGLTEIYVNDSDSTVYLWFREAKEVTAAIALLDRNRIGATSTPNNTLVQITDPEQLADTLKLFDVQARSTDRAVEYVNARITPPRASESQTRDAIGDPSKLHRYKGFPGQHTLNIEDAMRMREPSRDEGDPAGSARVGRRHGHLRSEGRGDDEGVGR
jgi:hypothetical protein